MYHRLRWVTESPYAKVIQDSIGFWIPSCGFRTPGTGLWIPCQWNLDSGFQSRGFYISQEKNFPNPYFVKNWRILGVTAHPLQELIQASCMLRLHPTYSLWQLAVILLCRTIAAYLPISFLAMLPFAANPSLHEPWI